MEQPLEELFAPEYYGMYRDFLAQSFTQPCVLTAAIDQVIGPGGAVRAALEENHQHWNIPIESTDEWIAMTKGWIVRHGNKLRKAVATRCETMPEGCLSDASCLTARCAPDQRCEQGSLLQTCVSSTDACGCSAGGWSTAHKCCIESGSTSPQEADACAAGRLRVPFGVACEPTHYDWCGCSPGSGWSSSGACCSLSSSSSDSELEACHAMAGPSRPMDGPTPARPGPRC